MLEHPFTATYFLPVAFLGGESPPLSKIKRSDEIRQTLNHEQANELSTKSIQTPNLSEPLRTQPNLSWHTTIPTDTRHSLYRDFETWLGACVACCAPCAPCALPGTSCSWRHVAVVALETLETLETWRVERRFCLRCSLEKKRPGKFTDSSHSESLGSNSDQAPMLNYVEKNMLNYVLNYVGSIFFVSAVFL